MWFTVSSIRYEQLHSQYVYLFLLIFTNPDFSRELDLTLDTLGVADDEVTATNALSAAAFSTASYLNS